MKAIRLHHKGDQSTL